MMKLQQTIAHATTEEQVIAAVRAYLESLAVSDLARLPLPCRAANIEDAEDVSDLAFAISRARLKPDVTPELNELLSQMDGVLGLASVRVAWIKAYAQRLRQPIPVSLFIRAESHEHGF
jgi:hypothetical protein